MKTTIILLSLAFALPAAAQDDGAGEVIEHTFTDAEDVEGGRNTAEGDRIRARIRLPRRSLVRPRTHFVPELLKSVEDM
jgi:hypothetical protein